MGFLALLKHLADNKPAVIQSESNFTIESQNLLKNFANGSEINLIPASIANIQKLLALFQADELPNVEALPTETLQAEQARNQNLILTLTKVLKDLLRNSQLEPYSQLDPTESESKNSRLQFKDVKFLVDNLMKRNTALKTILQSRAEETQSAKQGAKIDQPAEFLTDFSRQQTKPQDKQQVPAEKPEEKTNHKPISKP